MVLATQFEWRTSGFLCQGSRSLDHNDGIAETASSSPSYTAWLNALAGRLSLVMQAIPSPTFVETGEDNGIRVLPRAR